MSEVLRLQATEDAHRSACRCASTNHSHLSMPRETSVNRSAVSRSPSSLASSMAFRAALPNAARADDSASTWLRPSTAFAGYSGNEAPLRHHPGRPLGHAAELHRPLGDLVHVFLHLLVDLVEQLVQGDEVRPLDVPVGLLGLRLQVDAVGQPCVEQLDHLDAGRLGQVVLRLEHGWSPGWIPERVRLSVGPVCTARHHNVSLLACASALVSATGDQPPPEPSAHGVSAITKDQKMRSIIVSLLPQPPC